MILIDIFFPLKDPVPILTIVLFIILLAPILLRKLRIPSIIGLILAGMAIGDHGFNIIARGSIDLFGKAGLLYIMFLAGLELDMAEFKKNKYKSLVFGFFTFSIPLGLGYLLCTYVLHFSPLASLLVSSMFATHTLVAYPLASRMGITKNEAVTVTVGGTIITDTAVLLILAVIAGSAAGELNQAFWIRLVVSFLVFAGFVLFGFPPIGRWFFRKIKDDQTTHFIFVLALVFLASFLAQLAGVEAIIGAFLAGLALNQLIPHSSALMNRLEFAGNAIFIPFFLISVGMIVDLRVLLKGPEALYIAVALTAMALASKWLAAFTTQQLFRYSADQRKLMFGLSTSHAAATIAVILIGYNMHIVDENVLNGTIVLILVTCMTGSFVTANAGRRMATQAREEVPPKLLNPHERILIPADDDQHTEQLIDFSVLIYEDREKQPIYLLQVEQDASDVKDKILKSQHDLEGAIKYAASTQTQLQLLNRVDLNRVNGISRTVKEMVISDVVMQWEEQTTSATDFLVNKLVGSAANNLLDITWETVYLCRLRHPLNTTRRIHLFVTRNAEFEIGFSHWVRKVNRLSKELNAKIRLYTKETTATAIRNELKRQRATSEVPVLIVEDAEVMAAVIRRTDPHDLLLVISARKGTVSHHSQFDNLAGKIPRQYADNNLVLIYPEQKQGEVVDMGMGAQDITLTPIQDQLDNLGRIRRNLRNLFKPRK